MKNENQRLKVTDTFFASPTGEIVEVTRLGPEYSIAVHGKYRTGPRAGDDKEYSFRADQIIDRYPRTGGDVHQRIPSAFAEANFGQHVAHCTSANKTRTAAIRPAQSGYNISLNWSALAINETIYCKTEARARHLVDLFLSGEPVNIDRPYYSPWINQTNRAASILLETLTDTRVRIHYEMPNAGDVRAWRHQAVVGNLIFIGAH